MSSGRISAIVIVAVLHALLGCAFIYYRFRKPHNHFNGETSDELSLKLT